MPQPKVPKTLEEAITVLDAPKTASSMSVYPEGSDKYTYAAIDIWNLPSFDIRDPQQLIPRIATILEICAKRDIKPLFATIAYGLGISYQHFRDIVTNAPNTKNFPASCREILRKTYTMLNSYNEQLLEKATQGQAGLIFMLKNYYGYRDITEINYSNTAAQTSPELNVIDAKYADVPDDADFIDVQDPE